MLVVRYNFARVNYSCVGISIDSALKLSKKTHTLTHNTDWI